MKSWKTTVFGLLTFVAVNGDALGLPPKAVRLATGVTIALGLASAKDHNVTGGSVQQ